MKNITIDKAAYESKKNEDRMSDFPCPDNFFKFTPAIRSLIMTRAVTSLDSFVRNLNNTYNTGSTLSRANIRLHKQPGDKVKVQVSTCNDGDSPIILFRKGEKIPLFTSHHLPEDKRIGFGGFLGALNMNRSIGDQFYKEEFSQLTSTPDTHHYEAELEPGESLMVGVMSDGTEYEDVDKKSELHSAVDLFQTSGYKFTAKELVDKSLEMTKKCYTETTIDDTSVLLFTVTAPIEISEYTITIGVDDGHGGVNTAGLCSIYYSCIQEFWTEVFDKLLEKNKIEEEEKAIFSFLNNAKQQKLLKVIEKQLMPVLVKLECERRKQITNINKIITFKDYLKTNKTLAPYLQSGFELIKLNQVLQEVTLSIESELDSKKEGEGSDLKPLPLADFPKLLSQQIISLLDLKSPLTQGDLMSKIKIQMLALTSSVQGFLKNSRSTIDFNFTDSTLFSVAAVCLLANTDAKSEYAAKIVDLTSYLAYNILHLDKLTENNSLPALPKDSKQQSINYLALTTAKKWQTPGCLKMVALFGWQDTINSAQTGNNLLARINQTKRRRFFEPSSRIGIFGGSKIGQWQQANQKMQISLAAESRIEL